MNHKADVELLASNMSLGDTTRELCPRCNGGSKQEKSLSITLSEEGLVWQCFRASCSEKGADTKSGFYLPSKSTQEPVTKRKRFQGTTVPLNDAMKERIFTMWGITDPPYWYWTNDNGGRVAMSIRSPKYTHRGWVLRDIRGRSQVKALMYVDEGEEGISWYRQHLNAPTVVVEDIPSAARAMRHVNAVALCGTGVGPARAQEIAQYATRPIIIALDQDATADSFKIVNKWALLWGDIKVLPLKRDMKDTEEAELCQLLKSL